MKAMSQYHVSRVNARSPALRLFGAAVAVAALAAVRATAAEGGPPVTEIRYMTLDPGHFHSARVLK